MDGRVHYEVGAYRICRKGKIDEGRDGILWVPPGRFGNDTPALAAVADGIGLIGDGQLALKDFEQCYDSQKHIRQAVIEVLGKKHYSTFTGMQFPQTTYEPAHLVSLGDSSAIQVRRIDGEVLVNVLQKPDTLWYYLLEQYPELDYFVRQYRDGKVLTYDELNGFYEILKPYLKSAFSTKKQRSVFKKSLRKASLRGNLKEFQFKVFLLFLRIEGIIVLDLGSSRREVEQVIGWGKSIPFRPGDDFVLTTDGVDMPKGEVAEILSESSPVEAAERLVKGSKKEDDRAVVVVRVKQGVQQQAFSESVRLSLRQDRAFHPEAS